MKLPRHFRMSRRDLLARGAFVVGAASLHFREQSPPPALAGRPAPLDRASLERGPTLRSANPEEGACVY